MKNATETNKIGLDFISWKINKKKAVDSADYSFRKLIISLSIAFLVVSVGSQALFLIHQSIESKKGFSGEGSQFGLVKEAEAAETQEYKAEIMEREESIELKAEEDYLYNVKIKNVGQNIWIKGEVFLETGPFLRSVSNVRHPGWEKYYRATGLDRDIEPGEIANLEIRMQAKDGINGMIQENFQLVRKNAIISGSLFRVFATLQSKDIAEDVVQVNHQSEVEEVVEQKVEEECDNSSNIQETKPQAVIIDAQDDVVQFCSVIPYEERMDYEECRTNPNENDSTDGITEKIQLKEEPIIRVGLFKASGAERITCSDYYDVYAGNNILLSSLPANYKAVVSFNERTGKYTVSTAGITKSTEKYIRFVPRNKNSIMTLIDFENRPRWNSYLNYNEYRNVIEFRYSVETKKLWVINEVVMSDYLKGLAETTNYSPVEYQKVIATAARTYALYHYNRGIEYDMTDASTKHANEHFHVDAVWDQVYKGYGSEKQLSRLSEAVDETRGVAVTYNENVVVTPYFSTSDGRTRSWEEVWYGNAKPWLKSVAVPQDEGKDLWGHGVGMSARGALVMARDEGWSWKKVLEYFYTGIDLLKVY